MIALCPVWSCAVIFIFLPMQPPAPARSWNCVRDETHMYLCYPAGIYRDGVLVLLAQAREPDWNYSSSSPGGTSPATMSEIPTTCSVIRTPTQSPASLIPLAVSLLLALVVLVRKR